MWVLVEAAVEAAVEIQGPLTLPLVPLEEVALVPPP